jgi:hypothetical protein
VSAPLRNSASPTTWSPARRQPPELASLTKVHEESLYRLLRALAGVGVFREGENRTFSQTPLSDVLRTNAKPSLRHAAASMLDHWQFGSIQAICSAIENGRTGIENASGVALFEYLGSHPDEAASFNRCMTDLSSGDTPNVLSSYDFSGFEHIVDIAGGVGGMLAGILIRADRTASKILQNCRRSMKATGKLLVVDRVIGPPNAPDPKKLFDVAMMLMPGGRERNEQEWNSLYAASGFRLVRIIPTPGPQSIIEGIRS